MTHPNDLEGKVRELADVIERKNRKIEQLHEWTEFCIRGFLEAAGHDWGDWHEEDVREMHKELKEQHDGYERDFQRFYHYAHKGRKLVLEEAGHSNFSGDNELILWAKEKL